MRAENFLTLFAVALLVTGATGCIGDASDLDDLDQEGEEITNVEDDATEKTYTLRQAIDKTNPWLIAEEDYSCVSPVTIRSVANGKWVSTEVEHDGRPLRARAEGVGPWETYKVCQDPNGYFSFYSLGAKKWVTAMHEEEGGNDPNVAGIILGTLLNPFMAISSYYADGKIFGRMRARANGVGEWERFKIQKQPGGTVSIRASTGMYVSTRLDVDDRYGPLFAVASSVGDWEKFW